MDKICFYFEDIKPVKINRTEARLMIKKLIIEENKKFGYLNIIFCSDEYLLKINHEYLKHDYYTDIITFNYVENDSISGDLFISIDRIKDNAKEYNVSINQELHRVIFHGILHLIGYNDKSDEEFGQMKLMEKKYLDFFQVN